MPLETEQGYKKVIRKLKLDADMASIDNEIAQMAGGSRFKNKFKASDYEKTF